MEKDRTKMKSSKLIPDTLKSEIRHTFLLVKVVNWNKCARDVMDFSSLEILSWGSC